MYQHLYSRFLAANPGKQHFACHSHHYWPDVTRDAMIRYWDDSAAGVDDKWDDMFTHRLPRLKSKIATILGTNQPQQLVFAPNTHELLFRIISCLDLQKPLHILTTDSEFHSFNRQSQRLAELDNVSVDIVTTQPFDSFEQRFTEQAKRKQYDLVFFSHVFFNSAVVVTDLEQVVASQPDDGRLIVIDGYHGFMALPTDLGSIADRVFYLSGGYKYAQGGEGCCFAHVPQGCQLRPLYTGWFAEFGELDQVRGDRVSYSCDGMRFAGSTMDCAALYRLEAALDMLSEQGLTVARIHQYVQGLQSAFREQLNSLQHPLLNDHNLLVRDHHQHGHFYSYQLNNEQQVRQLANYLREHQIYTDHRGNRLRFGFALYQNAEQFDLSCLAAGPCR